MTDPGRPASPRTGVTWGEVLPLGVGALLIVAGVVLVLAVLWRGGGPSMPSAVAVASDASGVALATPSPLSTGTPSSTLAPTPTPQPTPRVVAETVADLTWRSVALLPGSADPAGQTVVVNDLAHGPHAYLAVGEIVDGFLTETGATGPVAPAIWSSDDGLAWQPADAGFLGTAIPSAVAAGPGGVLILASDQAGTRLYLAAGEDGWLPTAPANARVAKIGAVGARFVAIGERLTTHRQAIWTLADGAWRLTWESRVASGELLTAIGSRPDGSVLVGGSRIEADGRVGAVALVSADATSWTRAADATLPASMGFDAVGVGGDGAWFGAGFDDGHGGIGAWRSTDGLAWAPTDFGAAQLTEQPGDTGSATSVIAFDHRTIVLAYTSCCGDPPQRALISTDGARWARADRSPAIRSARLTGLLVEGDRVLAVGGLNRAAGVWLGTAAPRNGVEFATELAPPQRADVCGPDRQIRVRVEVDRRGVVARIRLVRIGDSGAEVGQVIWPYGWQAAPGPPLTISDARNEVVLREGDEVVLGNGLVRGTSYHLCELDGTPVWGG